MEIPIASFILILDSLSCVTPITVSCLAMNQIRLDASLDLTSLTVGTVTAYYSSCGVVLTFEMIL